VPDIPFDKVSSAAQSAGEAPDEVRRSVAEFTEALEVKRRELQRVNGEIRTATSPAERRKHKERKDDIRRDIFSLKELLRAAKGHHGAPAEAGALPRFVIIGTQKGGTTSLYNLLTRHPLVRSSVLKELHFFDRHFEEGVEWYRRCFPRPEPKNGRETVTGEATPYYMFDAAVPERLAEVLPEARLVAMLRNPVDRAYSHYHHQKRTGAETLGFEEAIEAEEARLRAEREKTANPYTGPNHRRFSYLSRGLYAEQLERWSDFLADGRLLVLGSEDFFSNPSESLARILRHLGLPDWELGDSWGTSKKASYEKMDPATRRRLEEYFAPHNRRLYQMLGADLGW
jgi:hypothetical protein